MSKVHVFPYGITLREGGVIDVFPVAEVKFDVGQAGQTSLFFVIDSGAAVSALPKSDAAMLGVKVEQGTVIIISGIGGFPIKGWKHEMVADLGADKIRLPLVFLDSDSTPRVLGRAGIFDKYVIIFEEHKKRSGFIGDQTVAARQIARILDGSSPQKK